MAAVALVALAQLVVLAQVMELCLAHLLAEQLTEAAAVAAI